MNPQCKTIRGVKLAKIKDEMDDVKDMGRDELDETIFNVEETMVYEYVNKCGRKRLIEYYHALEQRRMKIILETSNK